MLTDKEDALLIKPKEEDILEALEMIYSDGEKRKQLGRNALDKSIVFSAKTMARKYLQLYSS